MPILGESSLWSVFDLDVFSLWSVSDLGVSVFGQCIILQYLVCGGVCRRKLKLLQKNIGKLLIIFSPFSGFKIQKKKKGCC